MAKITARQKAEPTPMPILVVVLSTDGMELLLVFVLVPKVADGPEVGYARLGKPVMVLVL